MIQAVVPAESELAIMNHVSTLPTLEAFWTKLNTAIDQHGQDVTEDNSRIVTGETKRNGSVTLVRFLEDGEVWIADNATKSQYLRFDGSGSPDTRSPRALAKSWEVFTDVLKSLSEK